MKAAVLYETGAPLVIEDIAIDKPGPHEVLVRTVASGVCHSDLHIIDGSLANPLPTVLGHEAAGVVEAVGSEVRGIAVGDHVVTCISGYCGHCEDCLTGHMALCDEKQIVRPRGAAARISFPEPGKRLNQFYGLSAFAEYMLVHERTCAPIRKDMPLDRAALIGCAVTTGVGAVIHTARIEPGSTVVVIGCGGVGLAAINGAAIAGAARIIAVDRVPEKLSVAIAMGATDVIDGSVCDPVEAVMELTKGGAHYSFEAIGLKSTVEQAFRMVRKGGTATMVGLPAFGTKVEIDTFSLLFDRKLQGSSMGSNRFPIDMPRFVELYMQGRLKLDTMISRRLPLEDINQAFDDLRTGKVARSVIEFPG